MLVIPRQHLDDVRHHGRIGHEVRAALVHLGEQVLALHIDRGHIAQVNYRHRPVAVFPDPFRLFYPRPPELPFQLQRGRLG